MGTQRLYSRPVRTSIRETQDSFFHHGPHRRRLNHLSSRPRGLGQTGSPPCHPLKAQGCHQCSHSNRGPAWVALLKRMSSTSSVDASCPGPKTVTRSVFPSLRSTKVTCSGSDRRLLASMPLKRRGTLWRSAAWIVRGRNRGCSFAHSPLGARRRASSTWP